MIAVSYECGAAHLLAHFDPKDCDAFVTEEAYDRGGNYRPEVTDGLWMKIAAACFKFPQAESIREMLPQRVPLVGSAISIVLR